MNKKPKIKYEPFDRKTFNPSEYRGNDYIILSRLRNPGFSRACEYRRREENNWKGLFPNELWGVSSTALLDAQSLLKDLACKKNSSIIDLGCGMSPDMAIAKHRMGFKKVYALDLFECYGSNNHHDVQYVYSDFMKNIPIRHKFDAVISQAVLDLIKPEERIKFYKIVYKMLKEGGIFSLYVCKLKSGWGYNIKQVRKDLLDIGFKKSFYGHGQCLVLEK